MAKEKCIFCRVPLKPATLVLRGLKVGGLKCPNCGDKVFNEKQMDAAIVALQQKRLKDRYEKHPVRIGNSYGVILPKEVVEVFNLNSPNARVDIRADKTRSKIEITVL